MFQAAVCAAVGSFVWHKGFKISWVQMNLIFNIYILNFFEENVKVLEY